MSLESFIKEMPKVELHVHLEGSIRPETLLALARRNKVDLPANSVEELQKWYTFTDFPHFIEIYQAASKCLQTPDDIELIAREFLAGQAEQNILHSEVTYTAYTHYLNYKMAFEDQLAALNRARVGQNGIGRHHDADHRLSAGVWPGRKSACRRVGDFRFRERSQRVRAGRP